MVVTLGGISTCVKLEQPRNADHPMVVTLGGISSCVKLEQPSKE
jgi:hypothetical protein